MKTLMMLLLLSGLAVSCTSSRQKTFENIAYVAKAAFDADCAAGMVKIYYPAYSPMNIKAANSNLISKGIFVVGYGDLIQSQLLYQYQQEYNKHVTDWLRSTRQTDIDTLLKAFNSGGLQ